MTSSSDSLVCDDITAPSGMPIFCARPQTGAPAPVVVLMHERYGLVQHTRDLARRCARDGYFVFAPNFFFHHPDQKALNAGDSRYDLGDPEAAELIGEAVGIARGHKDADGSRVAVAGYCQTGRHPLVYAAGADVQAVVVWYGAASKREWETNPRQPREMEKLIAALPCPTFGAFGAEDHIISLDDVRRFRNELEAHRKSYEIHVMAGAPHGWLNDTMPGRYRKPQADAAWAHQQAFLKRVFFDAPTTEISWRFQCRSAEGYDFSKNKRLE
jgi:carboxymethylenebutenolidase